MTNDHEVFEMIEELSHASCIELLIDSNMHAATQESVQTMRLRIERAYRHGEIPADLITHLWARC